jgi:cytochrome c556
MRYGIFLFLLVCACLASLSSRAAEPADPVVAALHVSLAKNLLHAREYIDQKDAKSLGQTAGNLQLLAELLKARSDDSRWQEATGRIIAAVSGVQAAAKTEDMGKCKAAVDALENSLAASATAKPAGKPQSLAKPPAIRPLMLSLDAIFADAKVSLISGNVDAAKKQSLVVAELGKLVSNQRTTPEWTSLAGDFCTAATATANSTENDSKAVRQLIRGMAARCEACHEKSRTR